MRRDAVGFGLNDRCLLLPLRSLPCPSLVCAIGCWRVVAVAVTVAVAVAVMTAVLRLAGRVRSGVVRYSCRV